MKRHLLKSTALAVAGLAGIARAEYFTGPFGPDETWNVYQLCSAATFAEARTAAESMPCPGDPEITGGHLVTFSNRAENLFVLSICGQKPAWTGLRLPSGGEAAAPAWTWISGETTAFENWAPGQPYTLPGRMACVSLNRYGAWVSVPGGRRQPPSDKLPYVVEWETRAKQPVPGATAYKKVWHDPMALPKPVSGEWSLRWISGYVADPNGPGNSYSSPKTLTEAARLFDPASNNGQNGAMVGQSRESASLQPLLIAYTQDTSRQGWLVPASTVDRSFVGFPQRAAFIGAATGKIHVAKAGTYTMAISAEDCFALRIGGIKWKSVRGDGYVDPLDPLTVTQPYGNFCAKVLATIDLPAGDHLVEALWMTQSVGSEFHVLSAFGEFPAEGATTEWRALGYPAAGARKLSHLGVTDEGWTVECSSSFAGGEDDKPVKLGLQEALIRMELEKEQIKPQTAPALNFAGLPGSAPAHFPDAKAFPIATPEAGVPRGPWALRAKAKLVVPHPGQYEIGVHASGMAALSIPKGEQVRMSQSAQGLSGAHMTTNSFDFDGRVEPSGEPKFVTTWSFDEAGQYDIELFYLIPAGVSPSLAVFSSPFGPYPPALLSAGGAGTSPDVAGLPLITF